MSPVGKGPRSSRPRPIFAWRGPGRILAWRGPGRILARSKGRRRRLLAIPAVVGAGVLLVACGGSSSPSNDGSSPSDGAQEQKAETKLADDARCLREHGVNAEVATLPGGGRGVKVGPGGRAGKAPGLMEAAQKACARYQPEAQKVNLSPQQKVEREEAVDKFAKCMREHGIKVQGSANQNGGVQIQIQGHPGNLPNPESPAFKQAQSACQKLLPKLTGGG